MGSVARGDGGFALASHQRAQAATDAGWFNGEIAPLEGIDRDETIRPGTTLEGLAGLKPVEEGGTITAGVASQNCDGAAALLVASERAVREHNLKPTPASTTFPSAPTIPSGC